ncbi:MAG TPA: hypothetical protein EYQ14_30035 [Gammaproteobacteria bacterium]|nr:hypothetical protein [Gammaproteobacteria bacterium]|tara:strand:- start:130 stop:483 length:354 start_codon:yes stop_codon:yes gene_type:complete
MQILTINFDRALSDAIICEIGDVVCRAANIEEAYKYISDTDFSIIISSLEPGYGIQQEGLARLLEITSISTRILIVGEVASLADRCAWQDQGIEFIGSPSQTVFLQLIRASSIKPTG